MILKRKKFVIQWRKFWLKRSFIFKVINLWSLCLFSNFYLILNWFFLIKIAKKWGILVHRPRSWRGAELTWHTGPARMRRGTQGHVAGPRGPMWGAGGAQGEDTWQEATRVHADARVGCHMADGWQVKGPQVSGPWLEYWGDNAIALNRPPI